MNGTENEIRSEIQAHVNNEGSAYKNWYIGITNDIERRLFGEHCVSKEHGWWIYRTAANSLVARSVEKYFLSLGFQGGTGGGDTTANIVYAYRITSTTNP